MLSTIKLIGEFLYMEYTARIIQLFNDESFPRLALLDGYWGSGKTHFVKNELISNLQRKFQQPVFYFSLYGVSGIDDFRDRIISLLLTGTEESSRWESWASSVIDGTSKLVGESGVSNILSGVTGAYKYKLYSSLDDCILIIDDLERISCNKAQKDILGECLNLAENKNVKILIVANESKMSNKDDLEKVFVDRVKFVNNADEIANVLKGEFKCLQQDYVFDEFRSVIEALPSPNFRILKRALSKYSLVSREVIEIDGVDYEACLPNVLSLMVYICYANLALHFSKNEIAGLLESSISRRMENLDSGSDKAEQCELSDYEKRVQEFDFLFCNHYGVGGNLLDYCCGGIFIRDNILREFELPMTTSLMDKILNNREVMNMEQEEFQKGISELSNFIQVSTDNEIKKWHRACDQYIYFYEHGFVGGGEVMSPEQVFELCKNASVESFDLRLLNDDEIYSGFYSEVIDNCYRERIRDCRDFVANSQQEGFVYQFVGSWKSVDSEKKNEIKSTPFLKDVGIENIGRALEGWGPEDIFSFAGYMHRRYSFRNIEDFFSSEAEVLIDFIAAVDELMTKEEPGVRKGALSILCQELKSISSRLEERMESKS